jgi:hypothetical protein
MKKSKDDRQRGPVKAANAFQGLITAKTTANTPKNSVSHSKVVLGVVIILVFSP